MARREKEPPPVYECKPPTWLPKAHSAADLGYVGFYPPRPDQEEEILTDGNVKNGLHQAPFVPLETYSAQDSFHTRLVSENALVELQDLMNQIFVRKVEDLPAVAPSSFRLPIRVTLNDAKRQAWFADLANPDVPLQKLGKSVPHGAKGHDLLDLLHDNSVAIPRAVWFLRVFGGNETVGLRNKPHYDPTQYSVDWANLVTGYLRKQLALIALPMAPRPGLNVKQTFKGVLAEPDSRERCLGLLRAFYAEGLVDNRTFLLWLVQQMATCNLAQLGFVARMAEEYLDGMLTCRALTRPFIEYTLCRISEIRTTAGSEHLGSIVQLLHNILLRVLLALPDAFVNPRIWAQQSMFLEEAISDFSRNNPSATEQNVQALDQTIVDTFADIRRRNDAMLFRELPPRIVGHLSSALLDIKLLNSLSGRSDLETVAFFDPSPAHLSSFSGKLDILLTWSVTPLQHGDHRPYAAVSLLRFWRDQEEERAIRRGRDSPYDFIQDQLFEWLDSSDITADPANLHSVALVFGQLVKQGLFSYPHYIQRLIARGERGLDNVDDQESRHRGFLRWIPIYDSSSSLIAQRKVTLYGARAREIPEDVNERAIRKQIRILLPELFGGPHAPIDLSCDFCSTCNGLFSATRFEQVRLMHGWLLPLLKKWVASQGANTSFDASDPALQVYCIATTLLARCRSYGTMLELTLFTLEHASSNELLTAVLRTLRQHVEVWACMDRMQSITSALYASHTVWKTRGVRSRPLMKLLIELDDGRLLEQFAREQIVNDYTAFSYALRPLNDQPQELPTTLPEVLLLATDNSPDAPVTLANSLWYNYRSAPNWDWHVWDSTIACLRQLPYIIGDETTRKACSYKYAMFLTHVDQHLPDGFDDQVLSWFLGPGRSEIATFSAEIWDELTVILLYLSIHGALATTTILTGLIYPIWRSASLLSSPQDCVSLELQLSAANKMFDHLLLRETCTDGVPPSNFYELQGLQTRRRDVFRHPHFIALAENIPTLVLIEHNSNLPPHLQDDSRLLRETLCAKSVFRLGIYRDLETVHRAFENVLGNHDVAEELHEPLIDALKVMFLEDHDSNSSCVDQWQILSTSLTPWKLAATSIELRFTIKQLEEALARDGTREKARQALNRITSSLFKQGMCSEEVDFVASMVNGASVEVVARFVNSGIQRISDILKAQPRPRRSSQYMDIASKTGEVLRFLTSIADSCREEATTSGQIVPFDTQAQDDLVLELRQELAAIGNIVKASRNDLSKQDDVQGASHALILFTRIIQFTLGFPSLWTSKSRAESETICNHIFNLALLFASGFTLDTVIFPLLIDTLYYLLDEIPADPKATSYDPIKNYPKYELQQLPPDIPPSYRSCIRTLLPFVSLNATVADLAYIVKDNDSTSMSVPNRPWEWMEYLGDRAIHEAKDEKTTDGTIKNTTSLSLELFDTHSLGKCSIDTTADAASSITLDRQRVRGTLSELQETSFTESVFQRDWRESRMFMASPFQDPGPSHPEAEDEVGPLPSLTATERRSSSSRMGSPVSSVRSRGSVQPPGPSLLHHSPLQLLSTSGSTASDAIDVDSLNVDTSNSLPSTSQFQNSNKRKASEDAGDDDVQIMQGPSTSHKRLKGKTVAAKSKTKKR
ncbi:hypothetical protein BDY19DRAFT_989824 [Irpex rosettiformis]|uniref:Uncharacterized protein n=1 Tax=Irpex rosettiformis TaxID=378272 RepID=A0ACB8UFV7_9APHY|nr:hypothetical protein BDY19DRAFT_989824 [Irpex rosettiformis]